MSPFSEEKPNGEGGSVIVLGLFTLAIVFLFAAIAVDGVRLFHTRFALQKLADTAAIGVVGYTVQAGAPFVRANYGVTRLDLLSTNDLTTLAGQIVDANAAEMGWAPGTYTVNAENLEPESTERVLRVRVTVSREVNFLLIHRAPFSMFRTGGPGTGRLLSTSAESGRRRANVSLVLDVSQSMECPAYQPCTCLSPSRTGACPRPRKIDILRDAMATFLDNFDLETDRIHFVPFQLVANGYTTTQLLELARDRGLYNGSIPADADIPFAVIEDLLDAFVAEHPPSGYSNFSDGFRVAHALMSNEVGATIKDSVAYVFVTDGAPTAATIDLSNPKAGLPATNPAGDHIYTLWTNDFFNSSGRTSIPSALARRNAFLLLPNLGFEYNSPDPPFPVHGCPPTSPRPTGFSTGDVESAARTAFSCIENLGFRMRDAYGALMRDGAGNPIRFGVGTSPNDAQFPQWREHFYNAAVAQADAIRGIFYVIGIGNPAPLGADCYQGIDDSQRRKDYLLARIANDRFLAKVISNYPECNYTGYNSYQTWHDQPNPRQGQYFPLAMTEDIDARMIEIYRHIAVQIQLGLLS